MNALPALDAMISGHSAWNNGFFDDVRSGLSVEHLRKICPEYLCFTHSFPGILANLVSRVDPGVQFHLVAILYSELGSGVESNAHSSLFMRLCGDLGLSARDLGMVPQLHTTHALITGLRDLYSNASILSSIGAQYALEFQADNMLRKFRFAFSSLDSKERKRRTEGMEFFVVHESEELEHICAMRHALVRNAPQEDQFSEVFSGARTCLDLFSNFWLGLRTMTNHT